MIDIFPEVFSIAGRAVGHGQPPLVVAELSGNHNGDLSRALTLIDAAADTGAEAIKLQTYTADTITLDHDGPEFTITGGPWNGYTLYTLYQEASTPWEWHPQLFEHARKRGLIVFSSPFDETAVDFLEGLECPAYKIASFECIDTPLIRNAARCGKPLIISTGLTNQDEIAEAVQASKINNGAGLALLHCVSAYPAPASEYNLNTLQYIKSTYGVPVGLSDHTLGSTTAIAAVALGACIIEKHLTLSRDGGGPDAGFSLTPDEFKDLVEQVKCAWSAIGGVRQKATESETENLQFRRSLYVVDNLRKGEPFTAKNVRSIRPGYGLAPKFLPDVLGRVAAHDLTAGTALKWANVKDSD